jgi:hypothetical protein
MNTYALTNFVTGLGDLSLNNTMGATATSYVKSDTSFNLVPSRGLSISLWVSCSGQLDVCGTLISLYQDSGGCIELDIVGNRLFSGYFKPQPITYTITGTNNTKSATNSPNNNVNYIFTSDGSFTVNVPNGNPGCTIKVLLVGGGGGGGGGYQGPTGTGFQRGLNGGGGGAGEVIETTNIIVSTSTTFTITIGNGGIADLSGTSTSFGTYAARNGGNGANYNIASTYGGGGTYSNTYTVNTNNSTNYMGFTSGSGGGASDYGYGGGGAGAGGNGSNGSSSGGNNISDNGGNGKTPSNFFINNTYGIGGPTRIGGYYTGAVGTTPPSFNTTIWRGSKTSPAGQTQLAAPDNTGHGGIGGAWFYRSQPSGNNKNSYDIYGGTGGSGICIVSII